MYVITLIHFEIFVKENKKRLKGPNFIGIPTNFSGRKLMILSFIFILFSFSLHRFIFIAYRTHTKIENLSQHKNSWKKKNIKTSLLWPQRFSLRVADNNKKIIYLLFPFFLFDYLLIIFPFFFFFALSFHFLLVLFICKNDRWMCLMFCFKHYCSFFRLRFPFQFLIMIQFHNNFVFISVEYWRPMENNVFFCFRSQSKLP